MADDKETQRIMRKKKKMYYPVNAFFAIFSLSPLFLFLLFSLSAVSQRSEIRMIQILKESEEKL